MANLTKNAAQLQKSDQTEGQALKLIRGGRIVTAALDFIGDVLIRGESVIALGENLDAEVSRFGDHFLEITDASQMFVFPGAIDVHTHLSLPTMGTTTSDDFDSGTRAAAWGGTTSIIDFAIQTRGHSLSEALQIWQKKALNQAHIDYGFHMTVTDLNPSVEAELGEMIQKGVTSFKCFTAYRNALMVSDSDLYSILSKVKALGGMVSVHAENGDLIDTLSQGFRNAGKTEPRYHSLSHPAIGEGEATHRVIALSRAAEAPVYIVHLTCDEALRSVRESIEHYQHLVFAETCPQYLLLSDEVYEKPDFEAAKYVMSPPIRKKSDQEALWAALKDGLIKVIATDHCPFYFKGQKEMGLQDFTKIPNGGPGIEERVKLIYTYGVLKNRISLKRLVEVLCTAPARIFGMKQKGDLAPGFDADLVIFDPRVKGVISANHQHQKTDYSLYEGFETEGEVISVMSRGEWLIRDRNWMQQPARGRFLVRESSGHGI